MTIQYYAYKGNTYRKIDEVSVKNPVSRVWEPYVAYQSLEGSLYVREKSEFYKLFTEVSLSVDWAKKPLPQL